MTLRVSGKNMDVGDALRTKAEGHFDGVVKKYFDGGYTGHLTLEPEGFRLLSATDGDTALAITRAERPDLLLLDWNMPGKDGLQVCRALRAEADVRLREVPVVLLTGQTEADHTAAGFAAGVTDYVTKPFKPSHVVARVHAWLLRTRQHEAGR